MENYFGSDKLITYAVPAGSIGLALLLSAEGNRLSNSLLAGLGGIAVVYALNQVSEGNIREFLAKRLKGTPFQYAQGATPAVNDYGITEENPILPLPTATVDVPNEITLRNGNILLVPPPTDPQYIPDNNTHTTYGAPPEINVGSVYSATY